MQGVPGLQLCPQPCHAGPGAQLGTEQGLMLGSDQGKTRSRALSLQFVYQQVALQTLTAFWSEPAPCRTQAGPTTPWGGQKYTGPSIQAEP